MNILIGRSKNTAVKTTATRTNLAPSGSTSIETWSLQIDGQTYTFQCYTDRRNQWTSQGSAFGSVKIQGVEQFVWQE